MKSDIQHLVSVEVTNFKRFKSFELTDLGQFNLIVGDNNVGKTSVLEALLFEPESGWFQFEYNYQRALRYKNFKSNYTFEDFSYFSNKNITINKKNFTIGFKHGFNEEKREYSIIFDYGANKLSVLRSSEEIMRTDLNKGLAEASNQSVPFIPFYKGYDSDISTFYSRFIQYDKNQKKKLIESLRTLIPDIENIESSVPIENEKPLILVTQKNINALLPVAVFGDGTLKLLRILLEIIVNSGKRLMIDEVDAGIHFTRFREFWKTILQTAKQNNVQLFMTTHNQECLKYFVEVLQGLDENEFQENARNISLVEVSDRSVKAYTYNFEEMEANLLSGNELRGGIR